MRGMRIPPALALAAALLLAGPSLAAGPTWYDEEMGVSVDLEGGWDVATSPRTVPGENLGRPAARFTRGKSEGWLFVYANAPVDPAKEPKEASRLAAHMLASRYEQTGEVLVPGFTRAETLGPDGALLLEFEVSPETGGGVTRIGRAVMAVRGGRLHLGVAERPAEGAGETDLAAMERLLLSLRMGERVEGAAGSLTPVAAGPSTMGGAALPGTEFRSGTEIRRVAVHRSGLQVFRQFYLFDGGRLPSYLAHLMGKDYERDGRKGRTPDLCLLILNNTKGKEAATVRVEVELAGFSEPSARTVTVAAGESTAVSLSPVFSPKLYDLAEQKPGGIRLRVEGADGKVIHEETERMTLLGRNDFFWRDGSGRSWVPALAAFITPHDAARRVDALLRAAKDHCVLGAMVGYQEVRGASHASVVLAQVQAVYDSLAEAGFSYVNAPFSVDARAQRIKYPSESLEDRSGNCIEAVLVFASAMEALGMRPVVLVYEDHAQVAVRTWSDDDDLLVVETTLCGRAPFEQALEQGTRRFQGASKAGKPPEILDLAFWRAVGITPVPR